MCSRMSLNDHMSAAELGLLCLAAYYATLCNIAFNGLGGCNGEIKREREAHRIGLERGYMAARERVYGSLGWQSLPESKRESATRVFLSVSVIEQNLAVG